MSCRTTITSGFAALVIVFASLIAPRPGALGVEAVAPQEPADPPVPPPRQRPNPPPPPDEPPDPDFRLKDYLFSTDQSIQLFEARVKKDPTDFTSYRHLGRLYERKAKEAGDPAFYAKAEGALRASLKEFPDAPRV